MPDRSPEDVLRRALEHAGRNDWSDEPPLALREALEAEQSEIARQILARLVVWAESVAAPEDDRIHGIVADAVAALAAVRDPSQDRETTDG